MEAAGPLCGTVPQGTQGNENNAMPARAQHHISADRSEDSETQDPFPPSRGDFPSGPETPSGKGAGDENFPVGSILLPARLRPHVAAYYAFARAADDIADNGALDPADKVARLEALGRALNGEMAEDAGYAKAHRLRQSLLETGVPFKHALDLLEAFKQDAVKNRYADWQELLDYCELSANPVGRFLLDLHGEDRSGYRHSDALCTALQIINHLQDCGDDYHTLDRVYIPQDWMRREGVSVEDLKAPRLSPGLRAVLDEMLTGVDRLLDGADGLPTALKSRHLAMESAVIVRLAHRLTRRLWAGDPLARRVALSKIDFVLSGVSGACYGFFAAGRAGAAS